MPEIVRLSKQQVEYVYELSMKHDFPDNERKPLAMIIKAVEEGKYDCLGLMENEEILGYTFFYKDGDNLLFDYFAMLEKYRNKGIGAEYLEYIAQYYSDIKHIIGEVEDPSTAKSDEEARLQTRRMNFYLRNGYEDTGARAVLFGVDYIILRMNNGISYSKAQVEDIYLKIYREMLPEHMFEKNVRIR